MKIPKREKIEKLIRDLNKLAPKLRIHLRDIYDDNCDNQEVIFNQIINDINNEFDNCRTISITDFDLLVNSIIDLYEFLIINSEKIKDEILLKKSKFICEDILYIVKIYYIEPLIESVINSIRYTMIFNTILSLSYMFIGFYVNDKIKSIFLIGVATCISLYVMTSNSLIIKNEMKKNFLQFCTLIAKRKRFGK
jgi:hypothetical protein